MSALPARPSKQPRNPEIYKQIQDIKSQIDKLASKLQKDEFYSLKRSDVEKFAVQINDVIMHNREKVRPFENHLKAAIIDLTEAPQMSSQMQHISFEATLKDASKKLQLFLDCC
ncbi:MAG TPA: hypothetical protein VGJ00_07490 [Rhabdochlamydiaceae bacterium]|jgi:hypothetical protein